MNQYKITYRTNRGEEKFTLVMADSLEEARIKFLTSFDGRIMEVREV